MWDANCPRGPWWIPAVFVYLCIYLFIMVVTVILGHTVATIPIMFGRVATVDESSLPCYHLCVCALIYIRLES